MPSLRELIGRYEYDDGHKSSKFWTITYNKYSGWYEVRYGKIGSSAEHKGDYSIRYDGDTALKKIREKIAKGYRLVGDGKVGDLAIAKTEKTKTAKTKTAKTKTAKTTDTFDFMEELKKL